MRVPIVAPAFHRTRKFVHSTAGISAGCGLLSGLYVLDALHQVIATLGTSLPVTSGVGIALALGLAAGYRTPTFPPFARLDSRVGYAVVHFALAAWMVALPWLRQAVVTAGSTLPMELLSTSFAAAGLAFLVAVPVVGVPFFGIALLAARLEHRPAGESRSAPPTPRLFVVRWYLAGVTTGLLFGVFAVAPWLGVHTGAQAAALCGGLACLTVLTRRTDESDASRDLDQAHPLSRESATSRSPQPTHWTLATVWSMIAAVLIGAMAALAARMLYQLMPATSQVVYVQWAALVAGAALGLFGRNSATDLPMPKRQAAACLFGAFWAAVLPALFPWLVSLMLNVNSHVSHLTLQMTVRSLLAGALLLPVGIICGRLIVRGVLGDDKADSHNAFVPQRLSGTAAVSFVVGLLGMRWLLATTGTSPAIAFVGLSWTLALWALLRCLPANPAPAGWLKKVAVAGVVVCVAAAPFFRNRYDPARSARLLFSTNVFAAHRNGLEDRLLPVLDEGRLIGTLEGGQSTWTLWKQRGTQVQARENGVPRSLVSTDPRVCPRFAPQVMQAALPLALHEEPDRVLLIGPSIGGARETALAFPVQDLTHVTNTPALNDPAVERTLSGSRREQETPADPRAHTRTASAPLAVLAGRESWDVLIADPPQSALLQSAACFTLEFYERAAARLEEHGIFCQRFHVADYGAGPVETVAGTMQAAFENVMMIQVGASDYLLLGTDSTKGFTREGLADRLRSSHCRRVLGRLGWDWSVVLNLSAWNNETLARLAAGNGVNTTGGGHGAFRFPLEMMRWGVKWKELRNRFAGNSGRLLAWMDLQDKDRRRLLRRLSEVTTQRRLMSGPPDRYWAYRKTLKKQLKSRPRTVIRPVKGEEPEKKLHPEDRRRMAYFAALDAAATQKQPTLDAVRQVAGFGRPYDPLLTYFHHRETAELYARAKQRAPREELRHWLHSIYYASPGDRSVRNIIAALDLLIDHPQAAPEATQRWDHINGLLQRLLGRWQARVGKRPDSIHVALNDVEKCLAIFERTCKTMADLAPQCGIPQERWRARKHYLKRRLVRRLETYRSRLLPHYRKQQRKRNEQREKSQPDGSRPKDEYRPSMEPEFDLLGN